MSLVVRIQRLRAGAQIPQYMTEHAAGADLVACLEQPEITIRPGERVLVGSGCAIELPVGYEAQVRPRSGLALNHGITCLNSPGTIDSDYRGEIKAILINHGQEPFRIARGHKIAQMVIARHEQAELVELDALTDSARGAGGFGSTGMTVKS